MKLFPIVRKSFHINIANPKANIPFLESEIDLMFYALYGLSKEEIGIVENS